jgi:hypothetical protein
MNMFPSKDSDAVRNGFRFVDLSEPRKGGDGFTKTAAIADSSGQHPWFIKLLNPNRTEAFINPSNPRVGEISEREVYETLADRDYDETHIVTPMGFQKVLDESGEEQVQLVFPRIEGEDTQQLYVKEYLPSLSEIENFVRDVLHALAIFHCELRVGHNDLDLRNILRNTEGRYYLLDLSRVSWHGTRVNDYRGFQITLAKFILGQARVNEAIRNVRTSVSVMDDFDTQFEDEERLNSAIIDALKKFLSNAVVFKLYDFLHLIGKADVVGQSAYEQYGEELLELIRISFKSDSQVAL